MNRTIMAILVDVYHMTLDDIGSLTDFQIREILFHKRKETGEIEQREERAKRRSKRKKKDEKEEVVEEQVPILSIRNPRYKEYFDAFTSLQSFYSLGSIDKESYETNMNKLRAKFADLWPEEKKPETNPTIDHDGKDYDKTLNLLKTHLQNGLLNKQQFDEAVDKINKLKNA